MPAPLAAAAAAPSGLLPAGARIEWRAIGDVDFDWPPVPGATAAAAAGAANTFGEPPGVFPEPPEYPEYLAPDSDSEDARDLLEFEDSGDDGEDEEGAEDGTDRCAEALAARLTLLGMCSEQPLLLLLDEADAAMLQQGAGQQTGGLFKAMLLGMLRQLPQVG
jgi:hypothetical protein